MYQIIWDDDAKEDFVFWLKHDRNIAKRIGTLINDMITTPEFGIGKPEKLKYNFSGYWSRRINLEHRLIYKVMFEEKQIWIVSCKGHYDN